ncbi:hypothetical protein BVRB_3g057340 [Beta vulgaris subsp. vulgaris]|nr:hypothetical protein BVRB_3g057340 [Beta vulgaris subsp. vulgaris]
MEQLRDITLTPSIGITNKDDLENNKEESIRKLESTLPRSTNHPRNPLYFYQGFWCPSIFLQYTIDFQNHFQAEETDIIIATKPKSGTTWLKSLVYSVINRTRFNNSNHPLLSKNPHELAFFADYKSIYSHSNKTLSPEFTSLVPPRLISTHNPYGSLPRSVKETECRVVCMARNPYDTFVSAWKFLTQIYPEFLHEMTMEDYSEIFCKGEEAHGPHWDHVLGYWKESLERPKKVLFIKYEDMKENGIVEMKRLAEFLGCGFSLEEEKHGVIEEIMKLCSLSHLKELEVNKTGKYVPIFGNNLYFRKGEVGDWVNHFSPTMVERFDQMMKEKFSGSGLEFRM